MTEKNELLRDNLKEVEAIALKSLHSQPHDDDMCRDHLEKALTNVAKSLSDYMDADAVSDRLESMTNSSSGSDRLEEIAHNMVTMHKTLVQKFGSAFVIPFVREMAKMHRCGYTDGRNEAMGEACVAMCEALEKKYNIGEDDTLAFAVI